MSEPDAIGNLEMQRLRRRRPLRPLLPARSHADSDPYADAHSDADGMSNPNPDANADSNPDADSVVFTERAGRSQLLQGLAE